MKLAADLLRALEPGRIMRAAGLAPDPWQEQVLTTASTRVLLNCSRQSGKSTVTAALALRDALYEPPSLVLLLAPAHRQSKELFRKVTGLYRALGRPVPPEVENTLELELVNGSRIVCLPGQEETVRSFSAVKRLVVDEAARVPDDLFYAVRAMLAVSGGSIVGLSTPFGQRGWFYQMWTEGGPEWLRIQVPATECPRIPAAFLAAEQREMPPWWFSQEYGCEFMQTTDALFSLETIQRALRDEIQPLFPQGTPCLSSPSV